MLDANFLKKAAKETDMTVAQGLFRFKYAHPPLPALLAIIPTIKPRAYSIAIAPMASPGVTELLVLIDTWWCDEGERVGLTCDMLRDKVSGDHLWCRIKAGSIDPPEPEQPVLCFGSGLAPHMVFLREKVRPAEAGEKGSLFSLYFVNRMKAYEFLYSIGTVGIQKEVWLVQASYCLQSRRSQQKSICSRFSCWSSRQRLLLRETNDGRCPSLTIAT